MGLLECFTVQDPTRCLPEDVGFRMAKVGIEVVGVHLSTRAGLNADILLKWPWHSLVEFRGNPSADPTDMDDFSLTVQGVGTFVFECDDCMVIQALFDRCKVPFQRCNI